MKNMQKKQTRTVQLKRKKYTVHEKRIMKIQEIRAFIVEQIEGSLVMQTMTNR